ESPPHLLDSVHGNPLVGSSVQTKHRRVERVDHIQGMLGMQFVLFTGEPSIPGYPGFQIFVMRGIQPNDATAPTESRDRQLGSIALARFLGPLDTRVQIAQDLSIRHPGNDFGKDLAKISQLGYVSLTRVEL